jgi:hypothetical protein
MISIVQWLWGPPLGRVIRVKSWWPSFETCGCRDWRQWGIAWPTMLVDHHSARRETATPIWNWVWLTHRLKPPLNER